MYKAKSKVICISLALTVLISAIAGVFPAVHAKAAGIGEDGSRFNDNEIVTGVQVDRVSGITLNKETESIAVGKTDRLVATVAPETAENKNVSWSSSNIEKATVDQTGKVTAHEVGEVTITAKTEEGDLEASCIYTVRQYEVPITEIAFDVPNPLIMKAGEVLQLVPIITPSNATYQELNWSTESGGNIGCTQDGLVTAYTAGSGGGTGYGQIKVSTKDAPAVIVDIPVQIIVGQLDQISVEGIQISRKEVSLAVGETTTLNGYPLPLNANERGVTWESDTPGIATVVDGEITAVSPGTAVVTVKSDEGGFKETCTVTVTEPTAVEGVELNAERKTITVGNTISLSATILPENATDKTVIWSSGNNGVATVDNGVVTAQSVGETNISVVTMDGGFTDTCKIIVSDVKPVTGVEIETSDGDLYTGKTIKLTAKVTPADATDKTILWRSRTPETASVDSKGNVTGIKAGFAQIEAKAGRISAFRNITVKQHVKSVRLNVGAKTLAKGKKTTLVATVLPTTANNKAVTWKSSNKAIVTVSSRGVVKGIKNGRATISATTKDGKKVAKCAITVGGKAVKSVTLNRKAVSLRKNRTFALKATVSPKNATYKSTSYSSSNTKVATVTSKGTVKAVGKGKATITVKTKDGNKKAACVVTVK